MNFSHLLNIKQQYVQFVEELKKVLLSKYESEATEELIDKLNWMLDTHGDFESVVRMLKSFKNGTKRLKTYKYGIGERDYEWTYKDGVEKCSYGKNDKRAHFRWNHGMRYTLTPQEIETIEEFLKESGL